MKTAASLKPQASSRGTGQGAREGSPRPSSHAPRPIFRHDLSPVTCHLSPRGFTLPEMLIVAAIFMVILGALFISFLVSQRSYESADAYIQVQQEARRAFDVMVRELREAGPPAGIIASPGQLEFQVALGYNLAVPCPPNQICWGAEDQNGAPQPNWSLRYRLDAPNQQLLREILDGGGVLQGTARVLANNIESFNPSYASNAITLNLSVRVASGGLPGGEMRAGTVVAPLTTRVQLRNNP